VPVLVEQPGLARRVECQAVALRRVAQAGGGEVPEAAVAPGHRQQPGVFDLLVAPQLGQRVTAAREHLLGRVGDRVHVEQGAVGVEQDGARDGWSLHDATLLRT
jgi:hypothetical protein